MNYALIQDGVVINIMWLSPSNASDFPSAVECGDRVVCIGDTYADGEFYRDGEIILTAGEVELAALKAQNADMAAALEVLGVSE